MPSPTSRFATVRRALSLTLALGVGVGVVMTPTGSFAAGEPPVKSPGTTAATAGSVDFERDVLPLLKNSCLACHNQTKAKADLVLETPQTILKGGESGPAVIPGRGKESLLYKVSAKTEKPFMPPKDNKANAPELTSAQLTTLERWIDEGAKGEVRGSGPIVWQNLSAGFSPILSLALSPDGQFAACGRGNRLAVYHLPSRRLGAHLGDSTLAPAVRTAHRDLVNALAFSPDGQRLASGGYREIKIWRRTPPAPSPLLSSVTNGVRAFAVSADGRSTATGLADGRILIHSTADRDPGAPVVLEGHTGPILAVRFSPGNSLVVSTAEDRSIRVWDLSRRETLTQGRLEILPTTVAWVDDGTQLACGGEDGAIRLWKVPSPVGPLELVATLTGHEGPITDLTSTSTGEPRLASASRDGTARLWKPEAGGFVRKFDHGSPVLSLALQSKEGLLVTGGEDRKVRLWRLDDGKMTGELAGTRAAHRAAVSAERSTSYAKGQASFRKGAVESIEKERKGQVDRVRKATEAVVAAEKTLAERQKALSDSKSAGETARGALESAQAGLKKAKDEADAADAAAALGVSEAASAFDRIIQEELAGQASLIRAQIEKTLAASLGPSAKPPADSAEPNSVRGAGPAADAAKPRPAVAKWVEEVAGKARTAALARAAFDRARPDLEKKRADAEAREKAAAKALEEAGGALKKAELARSTADNELHLAIASAQKAADALSEAQNQLQLSEETLRKEEESQVAAKAALAASARPVRSLVFASDGSTLVTGYDDGTVQLWNLQSAVPMESLAGSAGPVIAVGFDGRGRLLTQAGGAASQSWDLNSSWELEATLGGGDGDSPIIDRVNALRFTPDGRRLLSGGGEPSRSGELLVWDLAERRLLREFRNIHSDVILSLDLTPDGALLASGGADRFARVVDLTTGRILKSLEGHTHHVMSVSWKRDGRTLMSAGADNVLKVWDALNGERKKNIDGFAKEVTSVVFVGESDQALAASGDQTVRFVRDNGEKVRTFEGVKDFVQAAATTFDGRVVVAGGQDGVLRVWDGADGKLVVAFGPSDR